MLTIAEYVVIVIFTSVPVLMLALYLWTIYDDNTVSNHKEDMRVCIQADLEVDVCTVP
jgi:hypothetical protein